MLHVAGRQGTTDAGTGDSFTVDRDALHGFDGKAVLLAGRLEQGEIASTSAPETEVVADDQMLDAQAAHQHLFDEFLGGQGGKGRIERADHRLAGAAIGKQLKFFAQCGEAGRGGLRREELARMRLESQHRRRQLQACRGRRQLFEQRGMAEMHAVEIADGEHNGRGNWTRVTAKDAHELGSEKNVEL